jgi:hypothetical protein
MDMDWHLPLRNLAPSAQLTAEGVVLSPVLAAAICAALDTGSLQRHLKPAGFVLTSVSTVRLLGRLSAMFV